MADNAIDKLFEEIRATAEELTAIQDEEEALQEQLRDLRKRHIAAVKHRDVLDVTLRKHIHTGMPVVQAKMVAHEELENSRETIISPSSGAPAGRLILNNSAKQASVNAPLTNISGSLSISRTI